MTNGPSDSDGFDEAIVRLAQLLDIPLDDPKLIQTQDLVHYFATNPLSPSLKKIIEKTIAALEKSADTMLDAGWEFAEVSNEELDLDIALETAGVFAVVSANMHRTFTDIVGTLNLLYYVYRNCDPNHTQDYTEIYTNKMKERVVENFHQKPEPL